MSQNICKNRPNRLAAQLLGLYFIVAGAIIMARRQSLIPAVAEFGHSRVLVLVLPFASVRRLIRKFNTPRWYLAGGLVSIVPGAYLAAAGFGFF